MHAATLKALEFDRIVEAVRAYALTPMGDERLVKLGPSSDPQKVAALLAATTQTADYLGRYEPFPLRASSEFPVILSALAVEGRALEAPRLLALAAFLESLDETRSAIRRVAQAFLLLDQVGANASSFKSEVASVRDAIAPSGDVVDHASPELRVIRDRLRKQRTRLRSTLESYLRGKDTAKYLQDQVVTERNGRYVLVVKAEHRASIPGIVHGASTSGASLYLEPLSTVEVNNEIVALEEQEAEEIRRILLQLTGRFRSRPLELQRTIEAACELDVLQARARFSQAIDGIEPRLSSDGALELLSARHPLLLSQAQQRTGDAREARGSVPAVVPVTIRILPPATALLISGPNTGGKTVALKTVGLLALMAQSGLRIPAADGSRLPVFRTIFADIGDSQSIDASLSTFSAHVTNLASMDRRLTAPGLVLLDEIGSGTDPVEGGALGVALVDHFRTRGAVVVATSHYDALKTYASTTPGVVTAAFGFDADTFAPTFELRYGSPGRSLALEIAQRLGLNPAVIAAARQNLTDREAHLAEHLAKIDRDMRQLEHDQRLVARERETLEAAEARVQQRDEGLRLREETSRKRLQEELDAQLRQARRQIDEIVDGLKEKTRTAAQAALAQSVPRLGTMATGEAGMLRAQAREAVDAVARRLVEPTPEAPPQPSPAAPPPHVGDRVIVGGLGLEAVVTGIHEGAADLDLRGKRMRASLRDLSVVGSSSEGRAKVSVHVELHPRDNISTDLNVIGCTVDEALARAERFLDESLLGDQRLVRVIHGYGTGQLKRALSGFLQQHPLVARFETAPPEQGGGGVTLVELKE
ncbi:MAG: hypothetical protein DMF90_10535 [Acidobacteria bacterium]|nr:MAG: hypothetical protein DMF90_10535 [Acidobacteriota bacterium]